MEEDIRVTERFEELRSILLKNLNELGLNKYVQLINDLTYIRYSAIREELSVVMQEFDRFELELNNTLEEISSSVGI